MASWARWSSATRAHATPPRHPTPSHTFSHLLTLSLRYDAPKLRVGVEFPPPFGLLSLKHSNLAHIEGGAVERSNRLLKEMEKRQKKGR